ncbi:MAG TPA: GerMN domain-containing protein [Actinomycetota bacterium]|nr:GerMN domain-containing protein [Actinomycetota bacterium]
MKPGTPEAQGESGARKRFRWPSPLILAVMAVTVATAGAALTSFVTGNPILPLGDDPTAAPSETAPPTAEPSAPPTAQPTAEPTPEPGREEDVTIYLIAATRSNENDLQLAASTRRVGVDAGPLPLERRIELTLLELLAGPNPVEVGEGLESTFIPATAGMLNGVRVEPGGRAIVDFKNFSGLIPHASTSAGSENLLGQLNRTMFQFEEVTSVTYWFDGSCDAFWLDWLGAACETVQRY